MCSTLGPGDGAFSLGAALDAATAWCPSRKACRSKLATSGSAGQASPEHAGCCRYCPLGSEIAVGMAAQTIADQQDEVAVTDPMCGIAVFLVFPASLQLGAAQVEVHLWTEIS